MHGAVGRRRSDGRSTAEHSSTAVLLSAWTTQHQQCRLQNDLYCVEWDVKLYYTIPYHNIDKPVKYLLHETTKHSLSLHLIGHFPGGSGLSGTRMSPFRILLEVRVTEVVVTIGAIRHVKLQSNHHHQKPTPSFFTGRTPFLSPNLQCQSTEGNVNQLSKINKDSTVSKHGGHRAVFELLHEPGMSQ